MRSIWDDMAAMRSLYSAQLDAVGRECGLARVELDILLFLCNNPQYDRAADIVEHRGIAKSHVSLSVKDLEHRKLLERRFEPADRRTTHLELTAQGRAVTDEGRQAQLRFFSEIYAGISPEDFAKWREIMQKIRKNLEGSEVK